jgi:iron complex outermembrane receptor protein
MKWILPLALCGLLPASALAGEAGSHADNTISESVTVTGDTVHLLATGASDAALGLSKPLIETPRAVTLVSDTTIARYGISGLDDLTAITPSAYTASFYGVEGQVTLRGTAAENYFRGFKRAENRGTYETPLGDAASLEILRGPPSPIYGAGKVGGLVNFVPKTQSAQGGLATLTYGSYSKRNATLEGGTTFTLGGAAGDVHAYGEVDDSYSFYRGLHPSHQLLEVSGDLALGEWSLSADYMYYHANGEIQTPGWNRLTQDLIDSGTYITGRNTSLSDADGNGRLTLDELGGDPYAYDPGFTPLACVACTDAAHRLDSGFGTTRLSPRTVYMARGIDFSNTVTHTGFLEAARPLAAGRLRLQLFADTLANDRFVSYGFPGSYRTEIGEARLRYDVTRDFGRLATQTVMGASYRYVHAVGKESYNSGVIALDRRDISAGARPNDIIDSPFNRDAPGSVGLGWENDVRSNTGDAGLFITSDLKWDDSIDLTLGGRYDAFDVRSRDMGVLAYEPAAGRGNAGRFTYSASLSYDTGLGIVPYLTNASTAAIEIGQASQVLTSLLANRDWLSDGGLNEAGIKFTALGDHLMGSLAWFVQSRTQLSQGAGVTSVMGTRAKGAELELRYVASANLSLTLAAGLQHTVVKGPDHAFAYVPARLMGIAPRDGFGGGYMVYDFSTLPGRGGDYENTLLPHAVVSPWLVYTGDSGDWGASLGATYVGRTRQTVPGGLVFPAHTTINLSAFLRSGAWEADANIDNVGDARGFTPDADTYANLGALPGIGRVWRITLKRRF